MTKSKGEALDEIVALANAYSITADEIAGKMVKDAPHKGDYKGQLVKTIFSYLGGLFIFSGLCTLVGMFWGSNQRHTRAGYIRARYYRACPCHCRR